MKKKKMFLEGLLLMAMTFGITGCAVNRNDKENEIIEDLFKAKAEYFIIGTVKSANGVIANSTITISDNIKTTTDKNGIYTFTVNEPKAYKLVFTADGYEPLETTIDFASGVSNHSVTAINVKLAKALVFGPMQTANGATLDIPRQESITQETAGTLSIPADGTDASTMIATVAFEEARVIHLTSSAQTQQIQASNNNIAIKTNPADAIANKDIKISISNPSAQADQGYFNIANMVVESKELPLTKAASPNVGFENNHYIITIPKGENIAGKYHLRVKFTKQTNNAIADGYNSVNGQTGVFKLENKDYSALTNISLKVKIKTGWEYIITPAKALTDAGASEALATEISKYIEEEEGSKSGLYEIEKELTASLSGNHVLYYGSKSMSNTKTYTFKVMVKGQSKDIAVTLKSYAGHKEEYTNGPISQHSGGGTGTQN